VHETPEGIEIVLGELCVVENGPSIGVAELWLRQQIHHDEPSLVLGAEIVAAEEETELLPVLLVLDDLAFAVEASDHILREPSQAG
jgi:hypothetical protein